MNQSRTHIVTCAVCGIQSVYHANWFLVLENRWLDHLKILSWHPALAEQAEIQKVCGEEHLRILLWHWLTQANLDLHGEQKAPPLMARYLEDTEPSSAGRLLAELAVHRYPRSANWTGSAQMFECIVRAITGREAKPQASDYSLASFHADPTEELRYAHAAGCA